MTTPAINANTLAVRCRGLVKRYGAVTAVQGLDLDVRAGECFGLLGPNGAGKTTTVEVLQGLLPADEGDVEILGLRWDRDERELRERMGSQLQETKLGEKLTVRETITLFRSFYRRGASVEDVLETVQLTEKRDAWVSRLSGGQRQRLAVACALVSEPDILFLDEPTTGLDPQSRRQLWDVIARFRGRGGTVVLTTHYMEEAERLCDRVAVIDHGRIIALGTPRQLIATLGAEHVVEFALHDGGSIDEAVLAQLPGVVRVAAEDGKTRLTVARIHETVPALMQLLARREMGLSALTTHHATLEDVFLTLTGRRLRDD
ncbi:MAG TPA: ABC transporter ATP-binding protein [Gemmatimonadales bacterium]|nr:ABC transporter ATP-binding protein [Gemmatimonadales bacterium]